MLSAAAALADRWRRIEGATIDVAAEMTRLTLDVLGRTIFSDGFGRDAEEFRAADGGELQLLTVKRDSRQQRRELGADAFYGEQYAER